MSFQFIELKRNKLLTEYYESIAPFLLELKEDLEIPDEDVLEEYSEEEQQDFVTKYISKEEYEGHNTIVGFSQLINGDSYEFRTNYSGATNGKFYELFDEYKTHRNLFDTNNLANNYYIKF